MEKRPLSKSKLIAYRQCPRRLWLEINRPELREDDAGVEARLRAGQHVGEVARRIYDPEGRGTLVDVPTLGIGAALDLTQASLGKKTPIFEAGLTGGGALAFADVLLPAGRGRWRMIEVKSSTEVKDYHADDVAIQAFAAERAGVELKSVEVACIDSSWVYKGGGDYAGLLYQTNLTGETAERREEVGLWVADAQKIAARRREPQVPTGPQCNTPFLCPFQTHCSAGQAVPRYPSAWLPRVQTRALRELVTNGAADMRDVPDDLLNARQLRVKRSTLSGRPFVRRKDAAAALAPCSLPAYFLDFETVHFAVPIWKGTRPYQQIPFQFSLHRLSRAGRLTQESYLDLGGQDPSRALAEALVDAVGRRGPVFVYNAKFEAACIRGLAQRFRKLAPRLDALADRLIDLLPIVAAHYYHPSQQGSWSLKAVLPALAPDLGYEALEGVQDGGMATAAYREAIHPETPTERRAEIERQLIAYCRLDTLALVRIWSFFSGTKVPD